MFTLSFTCVSLFLAVIVTIDARNLNLSEKELRNIGTALYTAVKNHVDKEKWQARGSFNLAVDSDDDFDILADIDLSTGEAQNSLSGKLL